MSDPTKEILCGSCGVTYPINAYHHCEQAPGWKSPGLRTSGGVSGAKDSGQRTDYGTGALRDRPQGKGRYVLLSPYGLRRIALRAEQGEVKYGDGRNWEKGMPISEFVDSAIRHLMQYMASDGSEDHLAAAAWNLQAAMQIEELHPEMQNIPGREQCYVWFAQFSKHGGFEK